MENEQGKSVTGNGDCYRAMLHEFLFTKNEEDGNIWFQQDSAKWQPNKLQSMFCVLFLKIALSDAEPPRSCDLTPLVYFLWGDVKDTSQRQLTL